jgi:hypothetical protein
MSVNLSEFANADGYALEAAMLATALNDLPLLAWVKGTQSLAAYYRCRYSDAVGFARVGLQVAGDDAQRIRLLSNGLARAAGKLGDRCVVDRALGEALDLSQAQDQVSGGMTPCIDLKPYGWARTAANAATAYLSAGDYPHVLELTRQLGTVVAESDSDWSRSLVSLDEATALALGREADLEQAVAVGMTALAASADKPIASIGSRAAELAMSLERRGPHKASQEFVAALHEWQADTSEPRS